MCTPAPPVLSQAQIDDKFRETYQINAVRTGLEYFNAGRYAVHGKLLIAANLLHHAVELLLKANLARGDGVEQIKKYGRPNVYGHSLAVAWEEFKKRSGDKTLGAFNNAMVELDKWEDIRYPDKLVNTGAIVSVSLVDTPAAPGGGAVGAIPVYTLSLRDVDALVRLLVQQAGITPRFFQLMFEDQHAARYFTETNSSPLL